MGTGLLVTELIGQGVNYVTGDYSRGASGFWVEGGEIRYPVEEITVAGNLRDMFRNIVAVGTDEVVRGSKVAGSLLIDGMTVGGRLMSRFFSGSTRPLVAANVDYNPPRRRWRQMMDEPQPADLKGNLEWRLIHATSFLLEGISHRALGGMRERLPAKADPGRGHRPCPGAGAVASGIELSEVAGHPVRRGGKFAKAVTTATGGKFQVTAHAAGELVPAFGVVDAVQNGTVECAHTAPYYFFGKDETFSIDCAIPFGLNSRQMAAWMYDGNGLKLMREFYARYNIVNFPMGNTGAQMGGWYRKEIKSVADMKGLKMRISNLAGVVLLEARRGAADTAGRRGLYRAGKGHDRCRRVGRAVRRPEARLQQGRAQLLLPGLVGRRSAAFALRQLEVVGGAVGRLQSRSLNRPRLMRASSCRRSTTPGIRAR
jgi:hypothetical protein